MTKFWVSFLRTYCKVGCVVGQRIFCHTAGIQEREAEDPFRPVKTFKIAAEFLSHPFFREARGNCARTNSVWQ